MRIWISVKNSMLQTFPEQIGLYEWQYLEAVDFLHFAKFIERCIFLSPNNKINPARKNFTVCLSLFSTMKSCALLLWANY